MISFADAHDLLASKMRTANGVSGTYTRGAASVSLTVVPGKVIRWPYQGAAVPPVGKVFFLKPSEVTVSGTAVQPKDGDLLTVSGRDYEMVALADEPPAVKVDSGETWKTTWLDITDQRRRDTLVDLEIPDTAGATRAASGNKDKTDYTVSAADFYVTITPDSAGEQTKGGRLVQVRTFRVTMAARAVQASSRLRVKSGWLDGSYLYVRGVTRESASGLETTCLCELVGG